MQRDIFCFLKVSGTINAQKEREFLQTAKFIFNHLPADCISKNLSTDVDLSDTYHFYSLWSSKAALDDYMSSSEFDLLTGAFNTLGVQREMVCGTGQLIAKQQQEPKRHRDGRGFFN